MKKSLIALAALAATTAFAQSSVQIVGTFDPSLANSSTTYNNGAKVSNSFVRNNSQGTSQITFKGVEDLGGGLKASFLFENDFDARYDANGPEGVSSAGAKGINFGYGGGEQFLALEGGFGKVQIGAANTPSLTTQASRQPFSTKIGGGFNGVLGTGHVRSNNSLVYTSPVMAGFNVAVAYGFGHNAFNASTATQLAATNSGQTSTVSDSNSNTASITDIGAFYANGPVSAGLSVWTTSGFTQSGTATILGGVSPSVTQTNAFASYDLGVAKLIAGFHTEKQDANTTVSSTGVQRPAGANAQGWNLAAVVPLSADLNLLANYADLKDKLASRAAAPLNKKIAAVGLKYNLSKMTSVYARYVDETNDNVELARTSNLLATSATSSNQITSVKTTLVGMQTNF